MISDFLKVYPVIKMLYFLSKLNKTCSLIYFSCTEDIVPKAPCNLELQRVIRRLKCHHCNVSPNIWITVSDFFVGNDSHPCLVTSNWKRLVVENLVRNGSLWSNFQQIWFRDLKFRIWGLEIKHLKAHNFVWPGIFFFHCYLATSMTNRAQVFTDLLFLCICWNTPTVKASLWQLPIVSTAFKY